MIDGVSRDVLNVIYTTQRARVDNLYSDDWPLHLTAALDSNVAGVQAPASAQTTLPVGTASFIDIQRFPDAIAAYIQLNSLQITSRQLAADSIQTILEVDYVAPDKQIRPVLLYDQRTFSPTPFVPLRVFPLPNLDAGLQSLGSFQFTVLATSAVASHIVTYDLVASFQILYILREPAYLQDMHTHIADMAGRMSRYDEAISGIHNTLLALIPGTEQQQEKARSDGTAG